MRYTTIMKRVQRQFLAGVFTMLFIASALLSPLPVQAAEANGQGITVSPVLVELNAERGKSYTIDIKVTNVTAGDLILLSDANDFKAKDDTGTPDVLFDEDNGTYSMRKWIEKPEKVRLKSKETKVVKAIVRVPANAEPGGHYGVVRFSGVAPELEDTGVALSASVGTLILARVAGDTREALTLSNFYFAQGDSQSWWFEQTPVQAIERITNTGTVHVKPVGTLELKDIFGRTAVKTDVNTEQRNVLPGSARRFEQTINKAWLIGPYSAKLELAYGTQGQVLQGQTTIWFIPWRSILLLILILVTLFFGGRWVLRRYNQRVLRKAGHHGPRRR